MRALFYAAAVLIVGVIASDEATAADRSTFQVSVGHGTGHGAAVIPVAHGYSHRGSSPHGYSHYGHGYPHSRLNHLPYHYPSYHHGYGCRPPVVVHPPIVIPYPTNRYGYHSGYGYYHGGVRVNTGRVGFSIAF